MKCPHCLDSFFEAIDRSFLGNDTIGSWWVEKTQCPSCKKLIVHLMVYIGGSNANKIMVLPRGMARPPLPPEVPEKYAEDYKEASLVLSDSPKASAALSRRCLQHLLRDEFKVKPGTLADEIQQVIDGGKLPTYLIEAIDGVRNIGNFAAHPLKSQSTGEIIDVEPGEAEWNLDVLEGLFDFFFVQTEKLKLRRDALNKKLVDAGIKPMK